MINKKTLAAATLALAGLAIASPALADTHVTSSSTRPHGEWKEWKMKEVHASSTTAFTGDGKPVVAGTVSAVNGSTVTVTTRTGVTYTVDASNAKVLSGKDAVSLSALAAGDDVVVQGTVNGTSIAATSIMAGKHIDKDAGNSEGKGNKRGFFGGFGRFFSRLFGF